MKLNLSCRCGARWKATLPDRVAEKFLTIWREIHSGAGHADCTPAQASKARMAEEDKWT